MACCAGNCTNAGQKGFVVLRFPNDRERRRKWIELVAASRRDPGWTPKHGNRLCEEHFDRSQWKKFRSTLNPIAVPTRFCSCPPAEPVHNLKHKKSAFGDHSYSASNDSSARPWWQVEHGYCLQVSSQCSNNVDEHVVKKKKVHVSNHELHCPMRTQAVHLPTLSVAFRVNCTGCVEAHKNPCDLCMKSLEYNTKDTVPDAGRENVLLRREMKNFDSQLHEKQHSVDEITMICEERVISGMPIAS